MKLTSNEPFWLVKNGLLNSFPSLGSDLKTDILIVGGGITGSLMAHQCIKDGYKVALVDRREIANGSTSATTSMLQYEIDIPLFKLVDMIGEKGAVMNYRACGQSIDRLGKLATEINSSCGFNKKTSLYFAAFKKDITDLKAEYEARKKHGFHVQWLSTEEILRTWGMTNTFGGILSELGASMDAFRFTHDILAHNFKKGLRIFDKTAISHKGHKNKRVILTTDRGHKIEALKVIYCCGYEIVEIIKEKFVDLLSTYAVVGERSDNGASTLNDTLFWNTATPYIYMRTTDDNRLLIGGGDEEFVNEAKRDGLIPKKVDTLCKYLQKILPHYNFIPDFAWAGTFGQTKDGLPFIGEHPDFDNTYFVLGFGGNGITFSAIGMEIISALLKGKTHPLSEYYRFGR